MRHCAKCNGPHPIRQLVEGRCVNTQRRRFCFSCSPFKGHNTRDLTKPAEPVKFDGSSKAAQHYVYFKRRRAKLKWIMAHAMGMKCQCCGYDKCSGAMNMHHLDPKDKIFNVNQAASRSWAQTVAELRKCVLLCCRCHAEVHMGVTIIPSTAQRFNEDYADLKSAAKLAGPRSAGLPSLD